jgi:hypothetical protein
MEGHSSPDGNAFDTRERLMIRVRNHDRFDDIAEFDITTGCWRVLSRSAADENDVISYFDGFYAVLSGTYCALFRLNGELFVRIGDTQRTLTEDVAIKVGGPPEERCLTLMASDVELAKLVYAVEPWQIEGDPTPFIEEEDFDFGLFLSNIASNRDRQAVMKGET